MAFVLGALKSALVGTDTAPYEVVNKHKVFNRAKFVDLAYYIIYIIFLYGTSCTSQQENYEERLYPPMKWVTTQLKGASRSAVQKTMFHTLFDYINGKNEAG